ncbi:hypothetical protein B0H16DRAFT_1779853 [Mycena metata]|uniref:SAP domain-containing protein n=1 Tax=Mycena metata TaxID=1033252 RepID=A0AAD7HS01_9AGAR|nr:hypothetical protein B0H16DRAFT_1779853 [Mycena metata]
MPAREPYQNRPYDPPPPRSNYEFDSDTARDFSFPTVIKAGTMSTTTQILFKSPALHSLKRDQLVKLCKIHSIKANGKNVELVERLKTHARNLPRDKEAEDGSSQGTLSSRATVTGKFGTGSSNNNNGQLVDKGTGLVLWPQTTCHQYLIHRLVQSIPQQAPFLLPTPSLHRRASKQLSLADLQTDHFTFDTSVPAVVAANLNPTLGTAPLPGHTLRPGVPAPVNARLSLGLAPRTPSKQGPTTTIRLVSFGNGNSMANMSTATATALPPPGDTPNLKPFQTTFDLDLVSPSGPESLYPALPASPPMDDAARRMSLEASGAAADEDEDVPMPGAFSTPPPLAQPKFVFGSPSPQPAPFSFSAAAPGSPTRDEDVDAKKARLAAEVMEEMNRRVFGEGTPPPAARVIRPLGSAKKSLGGAKTGVRAPGRFDKAHEEVFERMESIADVEARRQALKRKSSVSSVRVGFTHGEEARGKRVKVEGGGAITKGEDDKEVDAQKQKQQEKAQAEKEAIRRKLEASRARRRSSAAAGGARRTSGRVSGVLVKPKPKPGRFGFFAGAAKLVQGVLGKKATPAPLVPKPAPAPAASSSSTTMQKPAPTKPPTGLSKMGPPSSIPIPPIPTSINANANTRNLRAPSVKSVASARSSTAAGRARSPLPPSFAPGTASSKATVSTASSSVRTRNSSIAGASSVGTRTSSLAAGSMGTRTSSLRVGSMGTRSSLATTPSSTVDSARKRPSSSASSSSRLLAPTASSLAKMSGSPSGGALAAVREKDSKQQNADAEPLDTITNAPAPVAGPSMRGKGRLAPPRKPRISRSRVIAKLASQRVASGSSIASAASGASGSSAGLARKSLGAARVRSSLGTKVQRGSLGGIKNQAGALDAKKRARQSEYYARRKSKVGLGLGAGAEADADADAMNVDS